ncbi:hypothetical protein OBBRIDRAFT_886090 [Obba rivulosa]|uniref:Cep57 centrosome microtubule-binding domain-containing protein n=1 Tax=Obba rivulosa TaxID=1052685 RepID=A0A8E2DNB8_9APHY|nr:hypothetical protein OBBRIDRAFT_886090 [Obba rivulosa]
MSRRSSLYEYSIRGDETEQHRIQLEHNLRHNTDLSIHLSSTNDDSDVEYPRHNPGPNPFSPYASFEQRTRDHFDPDESQYHHWSYRTVDEDDAVDPYAGQTISTAAHHASALTLSAGLGGRSTRRDVSMSGAEYDPDRPLQGIVAGINTRLSALELDSTRSRQAISTAVDFDPVVVDDTAELDEVLKSGYSLPPMRAIRSPLSSSSSSSSSEPKSPPPMSPNSRPKLSDALHGVAFSPKRPRSAQGFLSPKRLSSARLFPTSSAPEPVNRARPPSPSPSARVGTPRPRGAVRNQSLSYVEPEVNVLPPTPGNSSKFTKMARGREIQTEQGRWDTEATGRVLKPSSSQTAIRESRAARHTQERNAMKDVGNHRAVEAGHTSGRLGRPRTPHRAKLQLPDVTGLTSAVESPAQVRLEFYQYNPKEDTETAARIRATLNAVHAKLSRLESEHGVSRKRVRELELELEACKEEIAHQRTKIQERETVIAQQHRQEREWHAQRSKSHRGDVVEEEDADRSRYKEAVQAKKELETLIAPLRAHLSRLTTELSEHQQLLQELRSLRDTDAQTLTEKGQEVDNLRQEVERLAGEVQVLRGVIEEGLEERKSMREQRSREDEEESDDGLPDRTQAHIPETTIQQVEAEEDEASESEEEHTSSSVRSSPTPSRQRLDVGDKTFRTDQATLGSSQMPGGLDSRPFIGEDELERISVELHERRSERSGSSSHSKDRSQASDSSSRMLSRAGSPEGSVLGGQRSNASRHSNDAGNDSDREQKHVHQIARSSSPIAHGRVSPRVRSPVPVEAPRPDAPTPAHGLRKTRHASDTRPASERAQSRERRSQRAASPAGTPFPQIRGDYLEQLFFSAPPHDAQTCAVCHRRRRRHRTRTEPELRLWSSGPEVRHRFRTRVEDEDEGFAEDGEERREGRRYAEKGKQRERDSRAAQEAGERVPPQTVLARVLRELEDDFTHYKSIYVELADQYKVIDAVSNVAKRNVLAEHLREVIDILEQKGDQIASLYDLLTFKDKPVGQSVVPERTMQPVTGPSSLGRMHTLKN